MKRVLVVAFIATLASSALAQSDAQRADALFEEGTRLLDQKKYEEACPILEKSRAIGPGIGVDLYLADCYEALHKPARALRLLREAETLAVAKKDARQQVAHDKAAALASSVAYVVIKAAAPNATLRIDDEAVTEGTGQLLVDPGHHVVRDATHEKAFDVAAGATATVDMSPEIAAKTTPVAPASKPSPVLGIAGLVIGGIGLAAAGVGFGFGADAISKKDASSAHCNGANQCDPTGLALRSDGLSSATAATALVITGLVLAGAGVVMWLVAPRRRDASLRASTWVVRF
jgi:tetratricopeptide (TPR) repeat protein